jgi:NitT/TauT family transport system ATP-binding protein
MAHSASPSDAFIHIAKVSKTYEGQGSPLEVLRDVDIRVASQQFISIIGASGCGKSTLLMMVGGLEPITGGSIKIGGQAVRAPRRDIGIIFQDPTLLPWKTALDNVLFPIEIFGLSVPQYRQRAEALLDLVGLSEAMHRRPRQLSGGMRQRVAICRALIHDPSVLLMDEPFSALDAIMRDELNVMLLGVWERYHQTAFFVTHSIREAVFLSDRVVVLGGRPSRVVTDLAIPFERPRDLAIGESVAFNRICGELRTAIANSYTIGIRREGRAAVHQVQ